ncbi:MAG: hypothetical protein ACOY0T_20125 [Myxococcota bacterium]
MKSEVNAVIEQLALAERISQRLESMLARLDTSVLGSEERGWLSCAAQRLAASLPALRETLDRSLDLPELKAVRAERQARLEQDWLRALRELFNELQTRLGGNSPLIEALFPHQRFERLERPGTAQRTYRAEFAVRRSSTYVSRMTLDPEYPFLSGLLEPVQLAEQALAAFDSPSAPDTSELDRLRATIVDAGQALSRVQRQARALAEAALIEAPELFAELGFDSRARRRSVAPDGSAAEN